MGEESRDKPYSLTALMRLSKWCGELRPTSLAVRRIPIDGTKPRVCRCPMCRPHPSAPPRKGPHGSSSGMGLRRATRTDHPMT